MSPLALILCTAISLLVSPAISFSFASLQTRSDRRMRLLGTSDDNNPNPAPNKDIASLLQSFMAEQREFNRRQEDSNRRQEDFQ